MRWVLIFVGVVLSSFVRGNVREKRMQPMPGYGAMVKKMQQQSMGMPDPHVGDMVDSMKKDENADEMGTYFESDMLVPMARTDVKPAKEFQFRWSNGVVPYRIEGDYSPRDRYIIEQAIALFPQYTCTRFVPYSGQKDYVAIENKRTGCWSSLGRIGGKQVLNLQAGGCTSQVGTAIHELMHALGIFHEQSRGDRDYFVNVRFENIERGKEHNFDVHKKYVGFGVPYDYGSVMHYSLKAFSKNNQNTLDPKRRNSEQIGQRNGFSKHDIAKINELYGCSNVNEIPDQIRPPKVPTYPQYPEIYKPQYPEKYPEIYKPQYPGKYPSQYPEKYPSQYPQSNIFKSFFGKSENNESPRKKFLGIF